MPSEHHIQVPRTARYWAAGDPAAGVADVWFVLHGYGQLAEAMLAASTPLAGPGRLVVAPEALSRFYPAGSGRSRDGAADAIPGASWMTREDRDNEIADYVRYLDLMLAEILPAGTPPPPAGPRVHVLGFSQGAATAARWVAAGSVWPRTLILWGGTAPADLGGAARERFLGLDVRLVHGSTDRLVDAASLEASARRLEEHGARVTVTTFEGGHRLDADILTALACQPS